MKLEHCFRCDSPTGRAGKGEDSLYLEDCGPYCEECFDNATKPHEVADEAAVKRSMGDPCECCGSRFSAIYWADPDQWRQVMGHVFSGCICPSCFEDKTRKAGLDPKYELNPGSFDPMETDPAAIIENLKDALRRRNREFARIVDTNVALLADSAICPNSSDQVEHQQQRDVEACASFGPACHPHESVERIKSLKAQRNTSERRLRKAVEALMFYARQNNWDAQDAIPAREFSGQESAPFGFECPNVILSDRGETARMFISSLSSSQYTDLNTRRSNIVIADIADEREKQRQKWGDKHDDEHIDGSLHVVASQLLQRLHDDWGLHEKYGHDRKRELTVAAALIVAEIERLQRAEETTKQ